MPILKNYNYKYLNNYSVHLFIKILYFFYIIKKIILFLFLDFYYLLKNFYLLNFIFYSNLKINDIFALKILF